MRFSSHLDLCAVAALALATSACPAHVQKPASDATPPVVTMDVYSVPLPTGAGPGDEEITGITSDCCEIRRPVPISRKIDILASGEDSGGVKRVTIRALITSVCARGFSQDNVVLTESSSKDSSSGPDSRIAQGSVKLHDYWERCTSFQSPAIGVSAYVYTEAENFSGGISSTKRIQLTYGQLR